MTLPVGIRGRMLALALVLIPAILVINYALRPLIESYFLAGDDLVSTRDEIVHYQRLLNELPALQAAVDRLERTLDLKIGDPSQSPESLLALVPIATTGKRQLHHRIEKKR